jgi:hypothetical protein
MSSHARATCAGVALSSVATCASAAGSGHLAHRQREERQIRDTCSGAVIDHGLVGASQGAVEVGHAGQIGHRLRETDLREVDVAEPDVHDLPLVAQLEHGAQRLGERHLRAVGVRDPAQVHDGDGLETKHPQVPLAALAQPFRTQPRDHPAVASAPGSELGDEDQVVGVGAERGGQDLVRDVLAVVPSGVDDPDPELDRPLADRQRQLPIRRRPPHARPRQAHRSEAHARYDAARDLDDARVDGVHSRMLPTPCSEYPEPVASVRLARIRRRRLT